MWLVSCLRISFLLLLSWGRRLQLQSVSIELGVLLNLVQEFILHEWTWTTNIPSLQVYLPRGGCWLDGKQEAFFSLAQESVATHTPIHPSQTELIPADIHFHRYSMSAALQFAPAGDVIILNYHVSEIQPTIHSIQRAIIWNMSTFRFKASFRQIHGHVTCYY